MHRREHDLAQRAGGARQPAGARAAGRRPADPLRQGPPVRAEQPGSGYRPRPVCPTLPARAAARSSPRGRPSRPHVARGSANGRVLILVVTHTVRHSDVGVLRMRVLLTGSNGYIGSVMSRMLLEAGHHVVGLDTGLFRDCTFGDEPPDDHTIRKDIRDVRAEDLAGFDAVIHLAALCNDPLGSMNPELTAEINYRASVRLAWLARSAGVPRFIFASSCSLYGVAGPEIVDETAAFNPITPYGLSKVQVEQEVARLATDDFSPTFMRNATAYGVSPRLRLDLVVNNLVAAAYATGDVLIQSDGTPWRPLVHVEDFSRAFIAVLHAPRELVHNQAFNVGRTSENYRVSEIAEIVRELVPGSR